MKFTKPVKTFVDEIVIHIRKFESNRIQDYLVFI